MQSIKFSDLVFFVSKGNMYPYLSEECVLQPLPGSEDKHYCNWKNERWILKDSLYDKKRKEWALFPYSEHVGSSFFNAIGITAQQTKLVTYKGRTAVICKDFAVDCTLREFKDLHQSSVGTDLSDKEYTYEDVLYVLENIHNLKNNDLEHTITMFWRMFIGDAILGNRDRHEGNWGFVVRNKEVVFSPIYDNGASLFPNVNLFNFDKEFVRTRTYTMPASQFKACREDIKDRAMRTNFWDIIRDFDNPVLKRELMNFSDINIVPVIQSVTRDVPDIIALWYSIVIYCRYNCLLLRRDFDEVYNESRALFIKEN